MIVFDLCCAVGGHRFEAWFASSESFAAQQQRRMIACPVCGDEEVHKAVMAPRVAAKSNQRPAPVSTNEAAAPRPDPAPAAIRAALAAVAATQAEMLPRSRWVGRDFADAARAMHEGRAPQDLIHGQASAEEAQALHEDGIAAMPLLVPFVPPDAVN